MTTPSFQQPTVLFGGSFDPAHLGHLHVANAVLAKLPQISQLVFVPCGTSPGKPDPRASGKERLEYLQKTLRNTPFTIWDTELKRRPPSFTVDTLKEAHRQGAARERLYWLMGTDAYQNFSKWREPDEIRRLAILLVVGRSGSRPTMQNKDDIFLEIAEHPASSTAVREALSHGHFPQDMLPEALRFLSLQPQNPYVKINK